MNEYSNSYNINYDLVVKIRFDTHFFTPLDFDVIDYNSYNVPSIPNGYIYNDVFAISTPNIMNVVAKKIETINDIYNTLNGDMIPEFVIYYVLTSNEIMINRVMGHVGLYRSLRQQKIN